MARRSAQNPRYQRDAELGKTRKSAASAKIKKPGSGSSKKGRGARGARGRSRPERPKLFTPLPTSPEIKKLRRIWWALLGSAVALSTGAWYLQGTTVGSIMLGLAYGFIFISIYLDFGKIRKMRNALLLEQRSSEGKTASTGKDAK